MFDPKDKFPRLFDFGVGALYCTRREARIALTAETKPIFSQASTGAICFTRKGQSGITSHATRRSDMTSREE